MAITPTGDTGKTIQLKRTSLAYNNAKVIDEQLNFGEPLYNDNDKTLIIGDNSSTVNNNLKVLKAVDRNKANSQVFLAGSGSSSLDVSSGMAELYTESNSNVYIKEKDWGEFQILPNTTTYNYTVNSDNVIVPGSAQSSSFSTLPCLVQITVSGMKDTYRPTISTALSKDDSTTVENIRAQNRALSCIGRCDSANDKLYLLFIRQPATAFKISVTGG